MCKQPRPRRRLAIFAAAPLVLFGCLGGLDAQKGTARLLDDACPEIASCPLDGSARRTTGVTSDSVGFHVGDGAEGGVTITLPPQKISSGKLVLRVFAKGHGAVSLSGLDLPLVSVDDAPSTEPTTFGVLAEPTWISLGTYDLEVDDAGATPSVRFRLAADASSSIELIDVRVDPVFSGC